MLLTSCNKMGHLFLNVIPNPNFNQVSRMLVYENDMELTGENPNKNDVGRIAVAFILRDISKGEYIETGISTHARFDARNWQEDNPGDYPYRQENFAHHAKEADEKVGIHAIDGFNIPVVCIIDGHRPI